MKAMKKFKRLISIIITAAIALLSVNVFTIALAEGTVQDEIPYTAHDAGVSAYNCAAMDVYNETEAAAAGVPSGYSGYVVKVTSAASGASGITLDFSGKNISLNDVLAVSLRVYYPSNTSEVRITRTAGVSWVKRYAASNSGTWDTVVLSASEISALDDGSGKIGKFNLGFRFSTMAESITYIDFVSVIAKSGFQEEIPFTDFDQSVNGMIAAASVGYYDEATGAASGVPAGYNGYVMKLVSNGSASVATTIDFSDRAIPVGDVAALTFRVYYTDAVQAGNGIRLSYTGGSWAALLPPSEPNAWTDIVITDASVLAHLQNSDGNLGKFGFGFRLTAAMTAYIDSIEVFTASDLIEGAREEIHFTDFDASVNGLAAPASVAYYNEALAAAAGVPAGYTGYVMKLVSNGSASVATTIDFSSLAIPVSNIESLTFRVYYTDAVQAGNGIRLSASNTAWVTLLPPDAPNTWTDVVITGASVLDALKNSDGNLGKFGFGFRLGASMTAYVDSITVVQKEVVQDFPESDPSVCKDEIPYSDNFDVSIAPYAYSAMNVYTVANGALSGVPAGYTGYAMKLTSGSAGGAVGLMLDFSDRNIPTALVESVNMRVYSPSIVKEVRVTVDGGLGWVLRHVPAATDAWEEISITDPSDIAKLGNGGTILGKFGLGMRFNGNSDVGDVYIDYVSVTLKADDGLAPVISYSGSTNIVTTAGKPLVIDAAASDNLEGDIPLVWTWSAGAVDGEGKLLEGQHTLTLTATDYYGHSSQLVLNLTVGPQDLEAPVIDFTLTSINSVVGAIPRFDIEATDNTDDVEAVITWSAGALDSRGRLTAGTHTMTVTAADLSGNETVVQVTVNVTAAFTTDKPVVNG